MRKGPLLEILSLSCKMMKVCYYANTTQYDIPRSRSLVYICVGQGPGAAAGGADNMDSETAAPRPNCTQYQNAHNRNAREGVAPYVKCSGRRTKITSILFSLQSVAVRLSKTVESGV